MHPYFNEQIAADRRQTRLEQADRHRLLRQQTTPSRRRPLTAVLKRALPWLTRVSPPAITTGAGTEPVLHPTAPITSASS
jgi:hypothetical protein